MKVKSAILAAFVFIMTGTAYAGVYDDLIVAVRNNDGEKVINLLQRGMDVNTVDENGTSLAMYAARSGNEKLLEYLLSNGSNILIKNKYRDTAISLAALQGHSGCIKLLVKAGALVNPEEGNWSPLNYAAFAGHTDVAAYLIEQGAKVDARAPNSMTSLMLAARNGHMEVVQLLLTNHADTSLQTVDGKTAEDIARDSNQTEISNRLRQTKDGGAG